MSKFSKQLKTLRTERNISQQKLSTALGYSYTAVANYESGRNEPSFDTLIHIAAYFNVTADYLLGISEFPQRGEGLSQAEYDFLHTFRNLSPEEQEILLKLAHALSR